MHSPGPMKFLFCGFTPPPPPSTKAVFTRSSHLSTLNLTLCCGRWLAFPYDWRGFAEAKEKTSVGLSVFNYLMAPPLPQIKMGPLPTLPFPRSFIRMSLWVISWRTLEGRGVFAGDPMAHSPLKSQHNLPAFKMRNIKDDLSYNASLCISLTWCLQVQGWGPGPWPAVPHPGTRFHQWNPSGEPTH